MATDSPVPGVFTGVRGVSLGWLLPSPYSRLVHSGGRNHELSEIWGAPVTPSVQGRTMTTIDSVREVAVGLPRSYEVLVRDRVKFRVGQIVYLAFTRDEEMMGFAFPKEERAALVASEPEKFELPGPSDMRFHWVGCPALRHRRRRDARAGPGRLADGRAQTGRCPTPGGRLTGQRARDAHAGAWDRP